MDTPQDFNHVLILEHLHELRDLLIAVAFVDLGNQLLELAEARVEQQFQGRVQVDTAEQPLSDD